MSLTQQAVQEIAELGAKSQGVKIDELSDVDYKAVILADGTNITQLESLQKYRNQFRGEFKSNNINNFIDYNKDHTKPNTACFILSDLMKAKTIFDIGNEEQAGHCKHRAYLGLTQTPEYASLVDFVGQVDQKELAEFIEDWVDNIRCYHDNADSEEYIASKTAIGAIRSVKIEAKSESEHNVGDFQGSRSLLESVSARTGDLDKKLPSRIVFTCVPFDGLKEYVFTIRLSILTGNSKPIFSLRIVNHEKLKNEMAEEFMSIITEKLADTEIKTYIGDFNS